MSPSQQQQQTVSCSVDPSFVLVGGGAQTYYSGKGAMLTESRPNDDGQYRTWIASSKDHVYADPHWLDVYAVGMRLDGVSRATLVAQMQIKSSTSGTNTGVVSWQTATDQGYTLIGGGAKVNWSGAGSLLFRSSPFASQTDNRTWLAGAKDHLVSSSASLTVYAIGIKPVIPGFGTLDIATRFNGGSVGGNQAGNVQVSADAGWVSASPGALSDWGSSQGRLLTGIVPGIATAVAKDKDHGKPAAGTLWAYSRQIRVKP
jgi:hypothetical protein